MGIRSRRIMRGNCSPLLLSGLAIGLFYLSACSSEPLDNESADDTDYDLEGDGDSGSGGSGTKPPSGGASSDGGSSESSGGASGSGGASVGSTGGKSGGDGDEPDGGAGGDTTASDGGSSVGGSLGSSAGGSNLGSSGGATTSASGGTSSAGGASTSNGGAENTGGDSSGGSGNQAPATFSTVADMIDAGCSGTVCHTGRERPELTHDSGLYDRLLSYKVMRCGNYPLVNPGSPETSAIIMVVTHQCEELAMPNGCVDDPCVSQEGIDTIAGWISNGAEP